MRKIAFLTGLLLLLLFCGCAEKTGTDTEESENMTDYLVRIPLDGSDPEIVWSGTE